MYLLHIDINERTCVCFLNFYYRIYLKSKKRIGVDLQHFVNHDVQYMADRTLAIQSELKELLSRMGSIQDREKKRLLEEKAHSSGSNSPYHNKSKVHREKVYTSRDSKLSELLVVPDFQTIYHIFCATLMIFAASILIEEYLQQSILEKTTTKN